MAEQISKSLASKSRSVVLTRQGMVCSASPLAASIGAHLLHEGANAFDTAVAVAAAECVTLAPMCGLGGELFALLYQASTGHLYEVTGCGRAPLAATRDYFVGKGYTTMPLEGPLSATIPGEVHGWQTILDRFGTLPLGQLLEPAITLADEGFPLPFQISTYFPRFLDTILRFPTSTAIFTQDGRALGPGALLLQRDLAQSLRRIAAGGPAELYHGTLARELAEAVQAAGGLFTEEDLAHQATTVGDSPPSTSYRGHMVYANTPPSQGFLLLEVLNILEGFDLPALGHNTANSIHVMAEAAKLAFADRLAYLGDPDFVSIPLEELLSKEFAAQRRQRIDMNHANHSVTAGALARSGVGGASETSYLCVVDAQGNAVSLIHSLSNSFGSGLVAGDTGILLNNRAGRGFNLEADHPNVIAPGKRTINTLHTFMVLREGTPVLVGGTPGGDRMPQWNVQVIANILDYGLNVQEAVEAPRWNIFPGTDPETADHPYELRVEESIPEEARQELSRRGHRLASLDPKHSEGAFQLIALDHATGVRMGGTDPRCDGYPMPQ